VRTVLVLLILLTTAVEVDRTGRCDGDKVDPDERQEAAGPQWRSGDGGRERLAEERLGVR
jgi:hypothetical protein